MVEKIEGLSVALYAIHSDLQSINIIGKDADKFIGVITRIANLQGRLDEIAREMKEKEAPKDVGNT